MAPLESNQSSEIRVSTNDTKLESVKNPVLNIKLLPENEQTKFTEIPAEASTEASGDNFINTDANSNSNTIKLTTPKYSEGIKVLIPSKDVVIRRTTVIIREPHPSTTESDILELLSSCSELKSLDTTPQIKFFLDNWFITFATEEVALSVAWWLRSQTLLGLPINVRMKSETPTSLYSVNYTEPNIVCQKEPRVNQAYNRHPKSKYHWKNNSRKQYRH